MAVPGGNERVPLLEGALERRGELAPSAFSVCPPLLPPLLPVGLRPRPRRRRGQGPVCRQQNRWRHRTEDIPQRPKQPHQSQSLQPPPCIRSPTTHTPMPPPSPPRTRPHSLNSAGLPHSAQNRLQVGPGASFPLGYGGMSTGVFISVAVRGVPRLAPALRRPVTPGARPRLLPRVEGSPLPSANNP